MKVKVVFQKVGASTSITTYRTTLTGMSECTNVGVHYLLGFVANSDRTKWQLVKRVSK